MKITKLAQALSIAFIAVPAFAQQAAVTGERIEITGSNIKRIQDETALPVQVITRKDIISRGVTSVEELMMTISANGTGADNLSSNVGIQLGTTDRNNNGNSSANLRGLGASSTLVLLNGRRIVNHGAKGNAVDLSSIPLSSIERVEVLKDGASAIYGTDAIGGVINFILRKDYQGVEATAGVDITQEGGGDVYRFNILGGWGDLSKDRFNVMGMFSYDKQDRLAGSQRSFHNGFQPDRGLSPDTTGTPFASQTGSAGTAMGASFRTTEGGTQTFNRANLLSFQGKCDSVPTMSQYQHILWGNLGFRYGCAYDYGGSEVIIQPVERTQFVGRGTFQINAEHSAFAELVMSRTDATKSFEPYQITTTTLTGANYPANGPYYQDLSQYISTFNRTLPIAYRWRCDLCGNREIETVTDAYRFLVGMEGTIFKNWDYKLGLSQSESKADSTLVGGYLYQAPMITALASGQVNPWLLPGQTQSAQAISLMDAARADGANLFAGKTKLTQFDGAVSGEVWQLPGGMIAAAVGFDYRKESYQFDDGSRAGQVAIYQAPFDARFPEVSRNVKAIYGEIAVPILKELEVTAAVRTDDYSDFGRTTNPKVAVRWHPMQQLLVRGSYNEGFRAPSFFQLYGATGEGPVPGNIADPVLCPNGNVAGADLSVCAIRPNARQGGNPNLTPETSKQWSVGFVLQPTTWFSGSVDAWEIKRKDRIYELTPQQVIANYQTFPEALVRGANGRLDDVGGYIQAGFVNADGDITKGFDVNLHASHSWNGRWVFNLDGTYVSSFKSRVFVTQNYTEFAGQWSDRDIYPRWKHQASISWETGPWSTSLYQNWTNSYKDAVPSGVVPPGFNPYVDKYVIYHITATYTGFKNLTLTGGVKNIFNTDPSFTAHNLDFAAGAGWDPRVADPRGRSFIARATYSFK